MLGFLLVVLPHDVIADLVYQQVTANESPDPFDRQVGEWVQSEALHHVDDLEGLVFASLLRVEFVDEVRLVLRVLSALRVAPSAVMADLDIRVYELEVLLEADAPGFVVLN